MEARRSWKLTEPVFLGLAIALAAGCAPEDPRDMPLERAEQLQGKELGEVKPRPGDWPWWRGPARDGKSSDRSPPVHWTTESGVLWKTPVPGRGHGTPSIWGEHIFLASADDQKKTQFVNCYDRRNGKELWTTVVHDGNFVHTHNKNSHASVTPACDGERVFVAFLNDAAIHVTALDFEGNVLWSKNAGYFKTQHGYGASPVLYRSLVIVSADNPGDGWIAALHRQTGEIVWKASRRDEGSFATPVVGNVAGRDQLLLCGTGVVTSYNPATGELLWFCDGPTTVTANTMAFSGDLVVASGGYPDKGILCIRADGNGDVSDTHVVWRKKQGVSYVPSPLVHDGKVYVVNDGGIVSCWALDTGENLWQHRLRGNFSASPVFAAGNFYIPNERGVTFVFRTAPSFEVVATNDLGDGGFASPVICGERIYLRTSSTLYCIGS